MEISKGENDSILNIIRKVIKGKNYEMEVRLCGNNFMESVKIDYYKFENILNSLIFSKEMGGYGFDDYSIETTLDVKFGNNRLTIMDKNSVKLYWLKEELTDNVKYKFLKKDREDKVDLEEYNVRVSLSKEEDLDNNVISTIIKDLENTNVNKNYRIKNRYSIITPDKMFKFDLTSIKMADGKTFKKSNVFRSEVSYEVELEYIGNDVDEKDIYNNLFKYTNILLRLYHNSDIVIKNSEINDVINSYKKMITYDNNNNKGVPFIVVNPVSLHKINLVETHKPNIVNGYAVALKADGLRNLLYVVDSVEKEINGNMYLLDNSLNVKYLGLKNDDWSGSIIEGEYIDTDKVFLAYDMLYERGNDIRSLSLVDEKKSRLGYLNMFLQSVKKLESNDVIIISKEYLYGENIFEKISQLWGNRDNYDYNVDGLIFTPLKDEYPKKIGTWDKLFKWKPAEYNSFDFLVKVEQNEQGKDIKSPYVIYKENGETEVYQYKTLNLYVGKYDSKERVYKPVLFDPEHNEELEIHRAKILLDRNEKMMAKDPITGKYEEVLNDTIVEFVYDDEQKDFKWIPIRVRHDKTVKYKSGENVFGNNERTANDIWKIVKEPLTYSDLSFGTISEVDIKKDSSYYACQEYNPMDRLPYQNFHNLVVKMNLIKEVAPKSGGKLLDLACGKAGDLSKWSNAKYEEVVSIDIDRMCLEYAEEYYEGYNKYKPEVHFIWGDTSKLIFPSYEVAMNNEAKQKFKKYIPSKYIFDVASSQFCLHYYFESEIKLRTLLQNVNDNLKIGGKFIGTCFDGQRVMQALKNKKVIEGKKDDEVIWKIEKLYKTTKTPYGKEIDVYVKSIDKSHKEYLVDYEYFDKMLVEYGFKKVEVVEFGEIYGGMKNNSNVSKLSKMSETEKEFSFLNNAFIYEKINHMADSLYKKLDTKKIKIKKK